MYQEIKHIIDNNKIDGIVIKLKKSYPDYWKNIKDYCSNFNVKSNIEMIYLYYNQDVPPESCKDCNKKIKFVSFNKGYNTYCSKKCPQYKKDNSKKRIEKMRNNGGVGLANPDTKNKQELTLKKKEGIINPGQRNEHKERMKVNNPMFYDSIKEKYSKSSLVNHNTDWPSKSQKVKNKTIKTNLKKYNRLNYSQIKYDNETYDILSSKEKLQDLINYNSFYTTLAYLNISEKTLRDWLNHYNLRKPYENIPEKEITNLLENKNIKNIVKRDRKVLNGMELDVFLPDYNIAIEYAGLYWHSDNRVDKNYHKRKHDLCEEKGIKLITIFEDEWLYKNDICINRIKTILGKNNKGKGGRELLIKKITNNKQYHFNQKYHIQGGVNSQISYGAYDGDNIVALMTFNKTSSRPIIKTNSNDSQYELVRFCTDGKVYPGVANKLFKTFLKDYKPTSIVSYCDIRWGTGELYNKLNFKYVNTTNPGYFYCKKQKRFHRWNFTKTKLVEKYGCDPNLSEYQNMILLGYTRVWDCGHYKFIWKKC